MKYFTDLEVECDGKLEGQYIIIYGKKFKIIRADNTGFYCNCIEVLK